MAVARSFYLALDTLHNIAQEHLRVLDIDIERLGEHVLKSSDSTAREQLRLLKEDHGHVYNRILRLQKDKEKHLRQAVEGILEYESSAILMYAYKDGYLDEGGIITQGLVLLKAHELRLAGLNSVHVFRFCGSPMEEHEGIDFEGWGITVNCERVHKTIIADIPKMSMAEFDAFYAESFHRFCSTHGFHIEMFRALYYDLDDTKPHVSPF